jgi:hypothetical protein
MNYTDFVLNLLDDRLYVEVFCQEYRTQVIDIFPNTENCPPRGLMYIFDNQLGGFSITGIKNSLEDKVNNTNALSEPR